MLCTLGTTKREDLDNSSTSMKSAKPSSLNNGEIDLSPLKIMERDWQIFTWQLLTQDGSNTICGKMDSLSMKRMKWLWQSEMVEMQSICHLILKQREVMKVRDLNWSMLMNIQRNQRKENSAKNGASTLKDHSMLLVAWTLEDILTSLEEI
jgi:hypothetical protein